MNPTNVVGGFFISTLVSLPPMYLTPFTSLTWAYQLHYYLCFRTHRRRRSFASNAEEITRLLRNICEQHGYHLLECHLRPDQFLCLVSLNPSHPIAKVLQIVKSNSSRELLLPKPAWARGYLARSVGRMRVDAVRAYLDHQSEHHGYETRMLPPVFRYRAEKESPLTAAHCVFELNHHLVFATRKRKGVFNSVLARRLCDYWLRVATARSFAIDQISIVPDHVHLIVRIVPSMSIEECTLLLMNNGQYFVGKYCPEVLVEAGIDQLWESSAYAGTCGDFTTAFVKAWLKKMK